MQRILRTLAISALIILNRVGTLCSLIISNELAWQFKILGILPFVIPYDYRGILGSLTLSLSLSSVALVVFLLLKCFTWKKLQDVTQDDFSLFGFSHRSLETVRKFPSFGSWLLSIFKRSRTDIKENFGTDVDLFLRGQIMGIAYTAIVCVVCLTIILPLNLTGHHFNDPVQYSYVDEMRFLGTSIYDFVLLFRSLSLSSFSSSVTFISQICTLSRTKNSRNSCLYLWSHLNIEIFSSP